MGTIITIIFVTVLLIMVGNILLSLTEKQETNSDNKEKEAEEKKAEEKKKDESGYEKGNSKGNGSHHGGKRRNTNDREKGLIRLLVLVMKADGAASRDEVVKACSYFKSAYNDNRARLMFDALIAELKKDELHLSFCRMGNSYKLSSESSTLIHDSAVQARVSHDGCYAIVEFLFTVACIGGVTPREWLVLSKIMSYFKLSKKERAYFRSCFTCNYADDSCASDEEFHSQKNYNDNKGHKNGEKKRTERKQTANGSNNYYAVLGLTAGASPEDVRMAYRGLVKKYHPDMVQDEVLKIVYTDKIKLINDAYNHLRG